jgi:hypothetical protein
MGCTEQYCTVYIIKRLSFGLIIQILTENLLSVYKTKTIFMNVQPQLERVSSTPPSRGRKNVSVRWREPPGALLSSISMDQVDFEILPPVALSSSFAWVR